jgi:hypothetical protein
MTTALGFVPGSAAPGPPFSSLLGRQLRLSFQEAGLAVGSMMTSE